MQNMNDLIRKTECLSHNDASDMTAFHIAFGVDANYLPPLGILITSIIKNMPSAALGFHIFTDTIVSEDHQKLEQLVEQYGNIRIVIYYLDTDKLQFLWLRPGLMSRATYYRIIIPEILYPGIGKALYLDSDMLCIDALTELSELPFDGHAFMAVRDKVMDRDIAHKKRIGFPQEETYFNAGTLYIDLKKWHEEGISSQALELLQENKFPLMDQDALNRVSIRKWKELPARYNAFFQKNMATDLGNNAIIHFAGGAKPWTPWDDDSIEVPAYDQCKYASLWNDFDYVPHRPKEMRLFAKSLWKKKKFWQSMMKWLQYVWMKFSPAKKTIAFFDTEYSLFVFMLIFDDWRGKEYVLGDRIPFSVLEKFKSHGGTHIWNYRYRKALHDSPSFSIPKKIYYRLFRLKLRIMSKLAFPLGWDIIGHDHSPYARRYRGKRFKVVEDGLGNYSSREELERWWNALTEGRIDYLPLGWDHSVTDIYLTGRLTPPNELMPKIHIVNLPSLWSALPREEKEIISDIFNFRYYDIKNLIQSTGRDIFLLTNNYAPDYLSVEEQIEIYDKILAKYDKNRIIIKPHPADKIEYEAAFPQCYILRDKFPFELCYLTNLPIKKVISINSAATRGLWDDTHTDIYPEYAPKALYSIK